MAKSRKIEVSEKIGKALGVNEEDLNRKLQELVDKKISRGTAGLFDEVNIAKDNFDTFTKAELVVLHLDAAVLAGFLEMKIYQIMRRLKISEQHFAKLMSEPSDITEEDVIKMFTKGSTPEDESFV